MKKKSWIWMAVAVVLVCGAAYWAYRAWSADDYLKALPARPKVLLAVDLPRAVEETGLGMEDLADLHEGERVIPDGIDWQKKAYAFVSGADHTGFLLAVSDEDRLAEWLAEAAAEGRCTEPEARNGRHWTVWDNSWMVGFDDRALLVLGPGMPADMDVLRHVISSCLRQDEEDSGMQSTLFADANKSDATCVAVARLDILPDFGSKEQSLGLPVHANLSDVNAVADLSLAENNLVLGVEIRSENPEVNRYLEGLAVLGEPVDGEFAPYVPADALGWFCVNLHGKKLLEHLREIPRVRTLLLGLNMGVDVDLMIKSIKGDLAATFMPQHSGPMAGGVLLTARLDNTDFLEEASYWKESAARSGRLTLRDFGKNRFFMSGGGVEAYFGVAGKHTLYVTPNETMANKVCETKTSTLDGWEDEISDSRFFLWLNVEQLRPLANLPAQLGVFRHLVVRSSDARRLTVELRAAEGVNVWKQLLK